MIDYDMLYLGGVRTEPSDPALLDIVSPHDGTVLGRAVQAQPADIDKAVAIARDAFDNGPWPHTDPAVRIDILRRYNQLREEWAGEIAQVTAAENGSAQWFCLAGRPGLTRQANSFLKAATELPWEETLAPSDPEAPFRSILRRVPVGVVAAIIPWNSPFSAANAKIIPALLAGNTVVLKVSPENSLAMNLLAGLLTEAGVPEGVISVLPADRDTSEHLVRHPGVDKIAFTGSTRAGRRIASLAGERLKRVSLELGGKSAAIILEDADLTAAVAGLKYGSLLNNGESCIAQTRVLVPRSRYDEVVTALAETVKSATVGDPLDPATFIGPMVRADQQQRVRDYIGLGVAEGARLVTGASQIPDGWEKGYYVTPTLFANDSEYGLSGGVWSASAGHALAVARQIRTGTVTVNGAPIGFDGPFGGFKASGIGREYGAVGLAGYLEYQTVTAPR
jgi:aldehyde dehydrogenase (NAD+)